MEFCNEIIPQVLYLGSVSHVTNKHKLQSLNIKYLVNAAKECVSVHYSTDEFVVDHSCAIYDLPTEDIASKFDYVTKVIGKEFIITYARTVCICGMKVANIIIALGWCAPEQARRDNYAVLVHCRAGVSRSATLVIAYLICQYKMPLKDALEYVQMRRPCVNPNKVCSACCVVPTI